MKNKIFITIFTLLVVLMNSLTAFAEPTEPEYLPTYAESTMTTENNMTKNNATRPTGEFVIIDGATTSTAVPTEKATAIATEIATTDIPDDILNDVFSATTTTIAPEYATQVQDTNLQSSSSNTLVIVIALVSGVIIVGLIVIIVLLLKKKS